MLYYIFLVSLSTGTYVTNTMKKTIQLLALSLVILTTSCQKDNTPSTPAQFKSFDISPIEINHAKEITSSEFIVRTNIDYTIIYDTVE